MEVVPIEQSLAICRLPPEATVPPGVLDTPFCAITRTDEELSIVLPESRTDASWRVEAGWRAFKVVGPMDFDVVGVVASLSAPMAEAGIPIFVISTFDTDYLLVKTLNLEKASRILIDRGYLEGS